MRRPSPSSLILCAAALAVSLTAAELGLAVAGFESRFEADVSYPPDLDTSAHFFGRPYRLRTNEAGFRARRLSGPRSDGRPRVAVLGDSMIDGVGMREGLTVTPFLEHAFRGEDRRPRFMNFGVAGAGPHEYETILGRYWERADADAVLLFVYANDLADMPREQARPRAGWKALARRLWPRLYTLAQKAAIRRQWLGVARLSAALERAAAEGVPLADEWLASIDMATDEGRTGWWRFEATFRRMRSFCRDRGLPLWTVYVPHPHQYDAGYAVALPAPFGQRERRLFGTSAFQTKLESLCAAEDVPFFDLTDALRRAAAGAGPLNFRFDQHWNARGHRAAADAIYGWLTRLNVFRTERLSGPPNTRSGLSGT